MSSSEYTTSAKDKAIGTITGIAGGIAADPLNYAVAGAGIPALVLNKYDNKIKQRALARKYDRQQSRKKKNADQYNENYEYTKQRKGGK